MVFFVNEDDSLDILIFLSSLSKNAQNENSWRPVG